MKQRTDKYLRSYAIAPTRPLVASSVKDIEQAVVIPALAEKSSLFRTLASLTRNPSDDLRHTLVICVVNNHRPNIAAEAEIRNNRETLCLLKTLVFGKLASLPHHGEIQEDLRQIAGSDLRLAFIDASSPGSEIPDHDGGVGTARKIGMDAVLGLIDRTGIEGGVICCLDADTLVEENYLSAIYAHFRETGVPAAVAAYAHQKPADPALLAAICCYEIFLRSYVMGLSYAHSPYAFHAIGSTMACTADGYVGVRGMNRRTAAEDFYFLNKLAKIGKIGVVTETTVFPSSRISGRVPFGTGRRMLRHMTGGTDEYRLYDPRIFVIIRKWLAGMEADPDRDPKKILAEAQQIHPHLAEYLRLSRLDADWQNIRRNSHDTYQMSRQFHVWFDGLKTLRLVHHLSHHSFPLVPMFDGLAELIDLIGRPFPLEVYPSGIPELDVQLRILEALRSHFPLS
jgi:glycosyltransferase involved in cell wall biosynthesis